MVADGRRVNYIAREAKAPKGWARLNLVSRGLVRGDEPVLPEQVMGWFNAAVGFSVICGGVVWLTAVDRRARGCMRGWGGGFWSSGSSREVCIRILRLAGCLWVLIWRRAV